MSGINNEGGEVNEETNIDSGQATKRSINQISNAAGGFKNEDNLVPSVLVHPMCFPLLIFLNDIRKTNEHLPGYVLTALKGFVCCDEYDMRSFVLDAAASNWKGTETDFTRKLLYNIDLFKIGMPHFTTTSVSGTSEEQTGKESGVGQVDLIFHKRGKIKTRDPLSWDCLNLGKTILHGGRNKIKFFNM